KERNEHSQRPPTCLPQPRFVAALVRLAVLRRRNTPSCREPLGERLQSHRTTAVLDGVGILDRERGQCSVVSDRQLRPISLHAALEDADTVLEDRRLPSRNVATFRRPLQRAEAPALELRLANGVLRDQPRRVGTVSADE